MPPSLRRALPWVLALTWVSGTAWWLLDRFGGRPGEFGPEPHPLQSPLLAFHGLAAFAAAIVLGGVWGHITAGWSARHQRASGVTLTVLSLALIATGWALYYTGDDVLRHRTALAHLALGLAWPLGWFLHKRGAG